MKLRHAVARGFTLIEMAIVLVVIGLILSGGLMAVAPALQNSRVTETNGKLDQIENALLVYAIRHGCLPCPAAGNLSSSDENAGRAVGDTPPPYHAGCASACDSYHGVVPWIALGLSEADVTDGFGYRISYAVAEDLEQTDSMMRQSGSPPIYPDVELIVERADGTEITPEAAYVLISHGPDHSHGHAAESGVKAADPYNSPNQGLNDGGGTYVQDSPISISDTSYFDDIVRFRTAPLMIQLCGAGACGNPA